MAEFDLLSLPKAVPSSFADRRRSSIFSIGSNAVGYGGLAHREGVATSAHFIDCSRYTLTHNRVNSICDPARERLRPRWHRVIRRRPLGTAEWALSPTRGSPVLPHQIGPPSNTCMAFACTAFAFIPFPLSFPFFLHSFPQGLAEPIRPPSRSNMGLLCG